MNNLVKFKNKKIIDLLKNGGRKGAREDFNELLKRSVRFKKLIKE